MDTQQPTGTTSGTDSDVASQSARAFRSVSNTHGHVYRAIIDVLADQQAEAFVTELTEADLLDRLRDRDGTDLDLASLRNYLAELESDAVITRRVNDQVTSLADLHRRALFWSLTTVGRAVAQSLASVAEAFSASGSLRLTALTKIADALTQLRSVSVDDPAELLTAFDALFSQQQTFQSEAERYIRNLTDADAGVDDDEIRFQYRKQALRTYLMSFLGELDRIVPRLAGAVRALDTPSDDRPDITALIGQAVTSPDLPDDRERQRLQQKYLRQWRGMYEWYAAARPRVRTLREHALSHASGLARMLGLLNMQRVGTRRLPDQLFDAAAYIGAAGSTPEAWVRLNALTGLAPAAHVQLLHDDPAQYPTDESWLKTAPVPVPISLRDTGQRTTRGRTGKLPDRSVALARMAADRKARRESARALVAELAGSGPFHLSEIEGISHDKFAVLLATLDAALSCAPDQHDRRVGTHPHADLTVTLTRPGAGRPAVQLDVGGTHVFTGPDFLVEVAGAALGPKLAVVEGAVR